MPTVNHPATHCRGVFSSECDCIALEINIVVNITVMPVLWMSVAFTAGAWYCCLKCVRCLVELRHTCLVQLTVVV
jgi:hypothetical protein